MFYVSDCDTDFFDIVTGILQGDRLAPFSKHDMSRLHTMNVNRSKERKWFHTKKGKN